MRALGLFASCLVLGACGGTESPSLPTMSVRFEHRAPVEVPQEIFDNHRDCSELVGRTHIHPSWRDYRVVRLVPEGSDLWSITFNDVPFGTHRIRVSDPNACVDNNTGAVVAHTVYANGVLLTRRVDTPGTGIEPGFAFNVDVEGVVTP